MHNRLAFTGARKITNIGARDDKRVVEEVVLVAIELGTDAEALAGISVQIVVVMIIVTYSRTTRHRHRSREY